MFEGDRATVKDNAQGGGENVLILGAGLVAAPAVEYLARKPGRTVTVASGIPGEATRLKTMLGNPPNVVPLTLDVVSRFCCFFCFVALFIDLLTDKVQPLSRCTKRTRSSRTLTVPVPCCP